jgi:hypothetical protein
MDDQGENCRQKPAICSSTSKQPPFIFQSGNSATFGRQSGHDGLIPSSHGSRVTTNQFTYMRGRGLPRQSKMQISRLWHNYCDFRFIDWQGFA